MSNILETLPARRTRRVTTRAYAGQLSGSYVQAAANAGEFLDPTSASDPNNLAEPIGGILDVTAAQSGLFDYRVTKAPAGYTAKITFPNTANITGWSHFLILKIYSAPGVELAAGAYPAAILADGAFEFEISGPNGTF